MRTAPSPVNQRRTTRGKATAAAKKRAKKKVKEDVEYEDTSGDEYTAFAKNIRSIRGSEGSKPPIGSFELRAQQFTVVSRRFGRGWLNMGNATLAGNVQ